MKIKLTNAEYEAQMERFHWGERGEYYTKDGEFFAGIYQTDPEVQRQMDEILAPLYEKNSGELSGKGLLLCFIFIVALLLLASLR